MRIQSVQTYQNNKNCNFKSKNRTVNGQVAKPSPTKEALKTGGIWLGFGLGLDFVCRKIVVFKNSSTKNSLFINGILALGAGIYTFAKNQVKMPDK